MDDIVWYIVGIIMLACVVGNIIALILWWDDIWKMIFNKDKQL